MAVLAGRKDGISRADRLRQRREKTPRRLTWQSGTIAPRQNWEPRLRPAARVHRTVAISLSEPGAEVQFPSLSLSVTPGGVSMLIAAAAGGILIYMLSAANFRVDAPVITGCNLISPASVATSADLAGTNLFLISPEEVSRTVTRNLSGIKNVQVDVGLDGKVTIAVQEREPILLWQQGGSNYWADAAGVLFPATSPLDGLVNVEVPQKGPEILPDSQPSISPELVVNVLEMQVALPGGSRIVFDSDHGLGIIDGGGWPVYFGSSGQIETKMDLYKRLLQQLAGEGVRPGMVDMENPWQPYYVRAAQAEGGTNGH